MNDVAPQPTDLVERPDGSFISLSKLSPREQLAHELTESVVFKAKSISTVLKKFKDETIAEMIAYRELMLSDYDIKVGGKSGGLTLRTADRKMCIKLTVSKHITFNEDLQAAEILIMECLEEWSETSGPEIQEIITNVFKVNKKGRLDTQGILGLRDLKIDHPKWTKAMTAIDAAVCRDAQTTYLYFFYTDEETKAEHRISLDLATV